MMNIDFRAFKPSLFQASIFTAEASFSTSKVMSTFFPHCTDTFNADPEVVADLPGFPPEVPRIILSNKEGTLRLEIAAIRVNFFGRMKAREELVDIETFYKQAIQLFHLYIEKSDFKIGRIAAVRHSYAVHETPGIFLARHFCKESWDASPLNRPKNFELHAHKFYSLSDDFKINSWARSKTGRLILDNKETPIVLFEQDLNTLSEEINTKSMTDEDIHNFYSIIIPEFDKILTEYYPELDGDIK